MIGDGPVEEAPAAPAKEEKQEQPAAEKPAAAEGATERKSEVETSGNGHVQDSGERIKASPVARRLAEEHDIDLRMVQGTGPGGRILKENVESFRSSTVEGEAKPAAAEATPAAALSPEEKKPAAPAPAAPAPAAPSAPPPMAPVPGSVEPMGRMRKAIARAMNQAKPGSPHIYVTVDVDMAEAITLRQQINASGAAAVKISVNDMVVKAVAKALRKVPALNSSYTTDEKNQPAIMYHDQVNVCVAIALEDGLVAPVVQDTDKKSLGAMSAEIKDLAARARENKLKQDELDKGTFTVSNLGMYDVVEFGAIITVPQAGILAVGTVRETPVVRDGEIVVGQMMYVTVSADHRVADGAVAAEFVREVKRLLEAPMSLLV
jgi:pyruvate dehydrogenase E2 component (dihydrolipoamide acetyltransferase)